MTVKVGTLPPVFGSVVWVTGIEDRPNGAMRVYVGHRYKGRYFLPEPADRETIRRAFHSSQHLWMKPSDLDGIPIFYAD